MDSAACLTLSGMIIGEKDLITPRYLTEVLIQNGVKDRSLIEVKLIENAGHFSFLSPFTLEMKSTTFLPSTDPEGFDRDEFHKELQKIIYVHIFVQQNVHK